MVLDLVKVWQVWRRVVFIWAFHRCFCWQKGLRCEDFLCQLTTLSNEELPFDVIQRHLHAEHICDTSRRFRYFLFPDKITCGAILVTLVQCEGETVTRKKLFIRFNNQEWPRGKSRDGTDSFLADCQILSFLHLAILHHPQVLCLSQFLCLRVFDVVSTLVHQTRCLAKRSGVDLHLVGWRSALPGRRTWPGPRWPGGHSSWRQTLPGSWASWTRQSWRPGLG